MPGHFSGDVVGKNIQSHMSIKGALLRASEYIRTERKLSLVNATAFRVEDYLASHGIECTRQHSLYVSLCLALYKEATAELDEPADFEDVELYGYHADIALEVSIKNPSGGMIGIGNSKWLNWVLGRYRIMQLHAVFHDAYGYMRREHDIGPGYWYAQKGIFDKPALNFFLIGHVTGLFHWLRMKVRFPDLYSLITL